MIITFTGNNSFMLNRELEQLVKSFLDEFGDMGLERLDGEETDASRMIEAAASLPFLSGKKMVILRRPSAQKQFADQLEQVIKAVPDTTDLIIVEPKLDKRSAYFKLLKNQTEYKEFEEQDANALSKWIVQYVKDGGGEIKPNDASYLVERVGEDQQMLANELDKLMTYNNKIDRTSIELLTEKTPQSTVFELLDAAFTGNRKRVEQLYREQRALKVEPQQIIAMIAWQLHVLALVKTAGQRTAEQIGKEAKINPFVVRKTLGIASQVSLAEVKKLISRALKLDVRLKTESIDADDALQQFLLTITS